MISKEHRETIDIGGFIYWKEFFQDRRGNPWAIKPTKAMFVDYQVFGMSKKSALDYSISYREVFFDKAYIEAWVKHTFSGCEFLAFQEVTNIDVQDKFAEFEAMNDIVTSGKNPRHSLYLKFKEFIYNDH